MKDEARVVRVQAAMSEANREKGFKRPHFSDRVYGEKC